MRGGYRLVVIVMAGMRWWNSVVRGVKNGSEEHNVNGYGELTW